MSFTDYRYDPFTDSSDFVSITDEQLTIPTSSPFTIRLDEVPEKASPSTVSIRVCDTLSAAISSSATSITPTNISWYSEGDVLTIDSEQLYVSAVGTSDLTVTRGYNSTVATTHTAATSIYIEDSMTEVSTTPTTGQFWPDYSTCADDDDNWNTGTILFNEADGGKTVSVDYTGMGSLVDARKTSHGRQMFTESGTFTVSASIKTVYISMCGGGAGGGTGAYSDSFSSGGGGGGAGACCLASEVTVTPNTTYTITVGSAGSAGSSGGASSFGSLLTCSGGTNGGSASSYASPGSAGSAGGSGGSSGASGLKGNANFPTGGLGGAGGSGIFGAGGSTNSQAASGYGAGGAGGNNGNSGGAGSAGFVLVEW